jgi:hypothetical protein
VTPWQMDDSAVWAYCLSAVAFALMSARVYHDPDFARMRQESSRVWEWRQRHRYPT